MGMDAASRVDDRVPVAAPRDEAGVAVPPSTEDIGTPEAVSTGDERSECSAATRIGDELGVDAVCMREDVLWYTLARVTGNKVGPDVDVTWGPLGAASTVVRARVSVMLAAIGDEAETDALSGVLWL